MSGTRWSREETLIVLGLYVSMPPSGRKNWDKTDDVVTSIAAHMGRTPDAVIFKIANLKASDPNRPGIGFVNVSRLDREIMESYLDDPDGTIAACSEALGRCGFSFTGGCSLEFDSGDTNQAGRGRGLEQVIGIERAALVKQRVNQGYFRRVLLDNYRGRCCVSGISVPALLVASHIKPWAVSSPQEKASVRNGLLLNALCDKAFDRGLMTVLPDYTVRVSSKLPHTAENERWIFSLDGTGIALPDDPSRETWPDKELLRYHNDCVFETAV